MLGLLGCGPSLVFMFGHFGAKIITPNFSPLQYTCGFLMPKIVNKHLKK
jgi:hypothetical protein